MEKRIFVAIPVSENLQDQVRSFADEYAELPVRWLRGKNLHITLIPPWHTEDAGVIGDQLKNIAGKFAPFSINFSRVLYGPNPRSPRLIWAEGKTPKELLDLKKELSKILGQAPDVRPFVLHMTLARFRPENFSKFPVKEINEEVNWSEEVNSIVLMESHLSPSGADYEVLERVEL